MQSVKVTHSPFHKESQIKSGLCFLNLVQPSICSTNLGVQLVSRGAWFGDREQSALKS